MAKSEVESQVYSEYDEQFPTLGWIVLVLLIVEFLISERKNRLFRKVKLFS
jgi:Ca-activated chloride channel family protein